MIQATTETLEPAQSATRAVPPVHQVVALHAHQVNIYILMNVSPAVPVTPIRPRHRA